MANKLKRKKTPFYLLLILTLLVAVFLRFYNFNLNSIEYWGDQGWDLIVARNILFYNLRPLVGPVLWVHNFYTPPTYYYLLALFLFIGKSITGTALLFQFINILSLVVLFLLIRELFDNWAGLAGALLFAVSREMVYQSRVMWQPHLLTLFILLALYFLVLAFKKRKMLLLWISYTLYFIALSVYPSPVILVPYFVWQLVRFRKKLQDAKSIRHFKITLIACLVSFILIYSPQIYFEFQNKFPTLKTFIVPKTEDLAKPTEASRLSIYLENMQKLFGSFYRIDNITSPSKSATTFLTIIFFVLLFFALKNIKRLPAKLAKKYEFSSQIIAIPLLILGSFSFLWFKMDAHAHRSSAYMPFMFIIFAFLFRLAFDTKNAYYKASVTILLLVTIVANLRYVWRYINYSPRWFPTTLQVADYIISDINKRNLNATETITYLISPGDFYGTDLYPILYFLQERINYPVKFVDIGNDVDRSALRFSKKPILYLICQDYKSDKDARELCLYRFIEVNPAYRPIAYEVLNFRFKIFKLKLVEG